MSLDADVRITFGSFDLDAHLRCDPAENVVVVGPNGAGKTTLLRAICGLERGRVAIDGRTVDDGRGCFVPPHARDVGLVPQGDHLLPHLDALGNVAFGLRCRGVRRASDEAMRWLDAVGLADAAALRPRELSGGQAKRVALARALAVRPSVLLLDEPFGGLDAVAAHDVRRVVRRYLREHGGVRVLVTHDPVDALSFADRIVVLEAGRIVQDGPPDEIGLHPRSAYVADFLGVNLYRGELSSRGLRTGGVEIVAAVPVPSSGAGSVTIHPRSVSLHLERPEGSPRNVWHGRIADVDGVEILRVRVEGDIGIVAEITRSAWETLGLGVGTSVYAAVKATEVNIFAD